MPDTALFDKLPHLRLPAFREGLREQQTHPQYVELTFKDRLTLLVVTECTRCQGNRIRRGLHTAGFPFQAAPEDLDCSSARGLDRRQMLELNQGVWIGNHLNILVLGPTETGSLSSLAPLELLQCGWATRCVTSTPLAYFIPSSRPARSRVCQPVALFGPHRSAYPGRLDARSTLANQRAEHLGGP